MKKVILLAIMVAVCLLSFGQNEEKSQPVDPMYPVVVNNIYNNGCPTTVPVATNNNRKSGKGTTNQTPSKGMITGSFNEKVVIEDHTGLPIDLASLQLPERYAPPVSNLKLIDKSFNRDITLKRYPAPVEQSKPDDHNHCWWHNDLDWLWFLLFLALVVALFMLATRPTPASTVTVHVPPTPAAPTPTLAIIPPSKEELEAAMEKAKNSGSIFDRRPDGGYNICFQDPKSAEQKPSVEEKKDDVRSGQESVH